MSPWSIGKPFFCGKNVSGIYHIGKIDGKKATDGSAELFRVHFTSGLEPGLEYRDQSGNSIVQSNAQTIRCRKSLGNQNLFGRFLKEGGQTENEGNMFVRSKQRPAQISIFIQHGEQPINGRSQRVLALMEINSGDKLLILTQDISLQFIHNIRNTRVIIIEGLAVDMSTVGQVTDGNGMSFHFRHHLSQSQLNGAFGAQNSAVHMLTQGIGRLSG